MNTAPKSLRASSGQRALVCPASIAEAEFAPDIQSDRTQIGNAFHAFMEEWAKAGTKPDASLVARRFGVDPIDILPMIEVAPDPTGGEPEVSLVYRTASGVEVPGHADLIQVFDTLPDDPMLGDLAGTARRWVRVTDYKTSAHPEKHRKIEQSVPMATYALAAMEYYFVDVACITYLFPNGEGTELSPRWEWAWITPETADATRAWVDEVWDRAVEQTALPANRRTYFVNDYAADVSCRYCPGRATCHGLRWKAAADLNTLGADPKIAKPVDTLDDIRAVWPALEMRKVYDKAARDLEESIKDRLQELERTVPLYGPGGAWMGRELYLSIAKNGARSLRVRNISERENQEDES